jgi:hypothetical protein
MRLVLWGRSHPARIASASVQTSVVYPWRWLIWVCFLAWWGLQDPAWANEQVKKVHNALALDPALTPTIQDDQSLAWYALARDWQTPEAFQATIAANPESFAAQGARRYLDILASQAAEPRPLQLRGAVNFQYDDNVILAPDDDVLEVSDQPDGRTVFSLVGRLLPVRTQPWRLGAEYSLFQSLHFKLSDFDLQTHTARIFTRVKLHRGALSIAADYTFTRRAKERFSEALTFHPRIFVRPTDNLLTVASIRYRRSNFLNQLIPEEQEDVRDRDGWNVRAGIDQYLTFNQQRSYARLSYYYEASRNQGSDWEYDSHQLGVGLHTPLLWDIDLDAEVSYRWRDYLNVNSFDNGEPAILEPDLDTQERFDHHVTASLLLTRKLGAHLRLSAGFVHTHNASNIDFFDYRRNIWTLAITGKY